MKYIVREYCKIDLVSIPLFQNQRVDPYMCVMVVSFHCSILYKR